MTTLRARRYRDEMTRWGRLRRWVGAHPGIVDGCLAAVLLVLLAVAVLTDDGYLSGPRWAYLVAAVLMTAPLAWRRFLPLASVAVVMAGLAGQTLVVSPAPTLDAALVPLLVSVFSVAAYTESRRAVAGLVTSLAAGLVWVGADDVFFPVVTFGGAWLAGRLVRVSAQQAGVAREHAEAVMRERAAAMRANVAEERARIAREVHDVVAHTLGVIVVQAGAERIHAQPGSPAHTTLVSIEQSGRSALEQMGRLLGMLRGHEQLLPPPGLDGLDELLAAVRSTGRSVDLVVTGEPRTVADDLAVSAHRIIQEALTNSMRHSGSTRVEVRLGWEPTLLRIEVRDDGTGPSTAPEGHGLVGIRERVALHGGALTTGRSDWGGFLLAATLPTVIV
jgi:signal transduction histidine kinase